MDRDLPYFHSKSVFSVIFKVQITDPYEKRARHLLKHSEPAQADFGPF